MSDEFKFPLFDAALSKLKSDRSLIAKDLERLDLALAAVVYNRIVDRRVIRVGQEENVEFLRATGGKAPKARQIAPIVPRGSAGAIPERHRAKMAGRPKPDTCEVCSQAGKIVFEHCHSSGTFRGWLCSGCNCALGFAADSPDRLRKLAKYLEDHLASIAHLPPVPMTVKADEGRYRRRRQRYSHR